MGWIWRKWISVGKKVLVASFVVFSAPFLVPSLFIASTIALISSLPYCLYLASYVCTEKLMRTLLPASAFGEKCDQMMLLRSKICRGDTYDEFLVQTDEEGNAALMAFREDVIKPLRVSNNIFDVYQSPKDMKKESRSLLESIRDEGRTNQSRDRVIYGKGFGEEDKESLVPAQHEGELESTTAKAYRGKAMDKYEVLYSEEEIWTKMEALRKIIGYSVARSTTYSEELKALYMFAGVELATSMLDNENEDIAQVSERLNFLMSVIGIK